MDRAAQLERPLKPHALEAASEHTGFYYSYTRVIEARKSEYQSIEVLETPAYGRVLRIDGITMTSERDEYHYHENLVHVPAAAHPSPRRVLVIGGGDGGAARQALKHACVEALDLVELDAAVVELSKRHLEAVHEGAFSDPRLTLHFADGRLWLEQSETRYDLIVLDLTDPIGPSHDLYTVEFYQTCRRRLAPGGMVVLHAESPFTRPRTYGRIMSTLRAAFPRVRPYLVFVPTYGTCLGMATASEDSDPASVQAEVIAARLAGRGVTGLRYYNAATHAAGFAMPNFVLDVLAADAAPVTIGGPRLDGDPELCGAPADGAVP